MYSSKNNTQTSFTVEELILEYGPVSTEQSLSREQFIALAERYPDLQMERGRDGKTTIMSPVKRGSGKREAAFLAMLFNWNINLKLGEVYGSSAGFELPDGSMRSPDVSYISTERLAAMTSTEEEFIRAVPDFVVEIRSSTDRLKTLQTKMTETWLANGVRLGWLIDPYEEKVWIYRPGREVEVVEGFDGKILQDEQVLPGFELPLETMVRKG